MRPRDPLALPGRRPTPCCAPLVSASGSTRYLPRMREIAARTVASRLAVVLMLLACSAGAAARQAARVEVDLVLVLAVDVSESMDRGELDIQRSGYVSALRHPDVIRAALSGPHGRIALAYFEWAGTVRPGSAVGWRLIETPRDAAGFAEELAALPVKVFRGTSISRALHHAAELIDAAPAQGARRVIDISGDGPNNLGPPVAEIRNAILARGISINGLPLLIRPSPTFPAMDRYYADCVTGGPASFVLPVTSMAGFAASIREKLILEISEVQPARVIPAASQQADCLVGERIRKESAGQYFPELDP